MRAALVLLALAGAFVVLLDAPRRSSRRRLIRWLYRHEDEALGGRKWESDRRAGRRRLLAFFSHDLANLIYPVVQLGGAAALPGHRRMGRYVVDLPLPAKPWPRPYGRRDVTQATFSWSPEAHANAPGFLDTVGRKFADALDRKWAADLFEVTDHRLDSRPRRAATYRLRKAAPMPEHLAAADELGA